jgi:predicted O-linked N-acetylglucosamine transferase (SPINDLY family)
VITENKEELLSILYSNLGVMYSYDSDVDKSVSSYKKALEYKKSLITYQNYLLDLNYIAHTFDDPMCITQKHKQITEYLACETTYTNDKYEYGEKEQLKIGFVSGDFINHSVSFFVKGILTKFNPERLQIYCYSTKIVNLKEHYPNVIERFIHNKNNQFLCDLIKNDKIDILIDLAGHTSGNRLQVFAMKPAPVQITYIGYPNTTGMPNMDYRITDKICDSEHSEKYYSETLVYMPNCFLNYSPFNPLPKLEISPFATNNKLRIGCYNRLNKLNSRVIELWKKILIRNKNIILVLKSKEFNNKTLKDKFYSQFKGVQNQIEIMDPAQSTFSHIELYNKIDIAFDPFPYSGTTTSCEALSMGVPVITLYDNERYYHEQNVTASLLHHSDLSEFIAYSMEEYETIILKQLEKSKEYWNTHKEYIRGKFLNSSICNSNEFYENFESKMFELYKKKN